MIRTVLRLRREVTTRFLRFITRRAFYVIEPWKIKSRACIGGYATAKLVVSHCRDLTARSRWRYRSWLVINERRAREKSKAIKPHCALLTNYPPWIVIASLCQSPSELHPLTRSICIPTFVLRKPRCLFLTGVSAESWWPFYRTTAVSIKISSYTQYL